MRRFFRSAAFPILIVLVLAFFVSRLVNPSDPEDQPTSQEFLTQVRDDPTSIEKVEFEQKNQTVKVTEADGNEYSTGYFPAQEDVLVNELQRKDVEFNIKGTGGSSLLNLLTYILPFLLFFGFWIF